MTEKRLHVRTSGNVPVTLSNEAFGSVLLETKDIADGGLFINSEFGQKSPEINDVLKVSLHGFMGEQPREVEVRVVRVDDKGFAIEFLQSPFESD